MILLWHVYCYESFHYKTSTIPLAIVIGFNLGTRNKGREMIHNVTYMRAVYHSSWSCHLLTRQTSQDRTVNTQSLAFDIVSSFEDSSFRANSLSSLRRIFPDGLDSDMNKMTSSIQVNLHLLGIALMSTTPPLSALCRATRLAIHSWTSLQNAFLSCSFVRPLA